MSALALAKDIEASDSRIVVTDIHTPLAVEPGHSRAFDLRPLDGSAAHALLDI